MEIGEWTKWVGTVGFPIALSGYLLIRVERVLVELRDAVRELVVWTKANKV